MGTLNPTESQQPAAAQRAAFEARYGEGPSTSCCACFGQPCTSFAQIAGHFGVTRERVRQWRGQWLPDAPAGLQRRRLCADYQQKRRLLLYPLFRAFHRHARASIGRSGFIPSVRAAATRRGRSSSITSWSPCATRLAHHRDIADARTSSISGCYLAAPSLECIEQRLQQTKNAGQMTEGKTILTVLDEALDVSLREPSKQVRHVPTAKELADAKQYSWMRPAPDDLVRSATPVRKIEIRLGHRTRLEGR